MTLLYYTAIILGCCVLLSPILVVYLLMWPVLPDARRDLIGYAWRNLKNKAWELAVSLAS